MKIHTRKHLLLIAAICAAGGADGKGQEGTARAQRGGPPSAVVLARRAVKAYDHLHYPLSATISLRAIPDINAAKLRVYDRTTYVRANDKRHWSRIERGRNSWFVSGSTRVIYSAKTKKYTSPPTNAYELGEVFGVMTRAVDQFRWLLTDPVKKPVLAAAMVTEAKVNGEAVYVLHLNPSVAHYSVIALGKTDSLIRRIEITYTPGDLSTYTYRIKREPKPFPPATFVRPFAGRAGPVMPATTESPTPSGPPM